MMEIIIITM